MPFRAMNEDPDVMEHLPSPMTAKESDHFVDRIEAGFAERGWGLWAAELVATGEFMGYVGLHPAVFEAPFTPAIEIGWRLAKPFWNRGLATEASLEVTRHAFGPLQINEIVSFTATTNAASRRVMEKIGMTRDMGGDFDHPNVPPGPLRRHVLYRLSGA